MRNLCGFITASALLLIVTGCGGGGGDGGGTIDNTPPPPPPLDAVQNGVFKDSNVSGLDFKSGLQSGITDANGRFTCETGTDVVFSIGNVGVGQAECTTLIMPPSLVATGAIDDPETINIARFLQMLDEDGSPDGIPTDGIEIASDVQALADLWDPVDFTTTNLENELISILTDVASNSGSTATLPNASDAQQHLEDSLACAYAGAFAGSFSGTNSGAMEMLVGGGGALQVFQPIGAEWFGWDSKAEQGFFGGASDVVELSARPTINSGPTDSGPINSQYITPDSIEGTWAGGMFDVSRLGGDVGKYRFIGKFAGGVNEGIASGGVIVLHLHQDGNSVTGEAFETTEGIRFQVTGSVSGDLITMTATGGGETVNATATIIRDVMEPIGATGTWPEGTINLVSCRLN